MKRLCRKSRLDKAMSLLVLWLIKTSMRQKDSNLLNFDIKKQSFPFPAHIGVVNHYIRILLQNLR